MKRPMRLTALIFTFIAVAGLSLSGAVWAAPLGQGTLPLGPCAPHQESLAPRSPLLSVSLNVCTGLVTVPTGAFPRGGLAVVDEVLEEDLVEISPAPRGYEFLGNGLNFDLLDADGEPLNFFARAVTICFPLPPRTVGVIRHWDESRTPPSWIAFPTFRVRVPADMICTRTRLPGTYAPIGRASTTTTRTATPTLTATSTP